MSKENISPNGDRMKLTENQKCQLESIYLTQKFVDGVQARKLSDELGVSFKQIRTWFQNKRAKARRKDFKESGQQYPLVMKLSCKSLIQLTAFQNEQTQSLVEISPSLVEFETQIPKGLPLVEVTDWINNVQLSSTEDTSVIYSTENIYPSSSNGREMAPTAFGTSLQNCSLDGLSFDSSRYLAVPSSREAFNTYRQATSSPLYSSCESLTSSDLSRQMAFSSSSSWGEENRNCKPDVFRDSNEFPLSDQFCTRPEVEEPLSLVSGQIDLNGSSRFDRELAPIVLSTGDVSQAIESDSDLILDDFFDEIDDDVDRNEQKTVDDILQFLLSE